MSPRLRSPPERYGTVAVAIHWLTALVILGLVVTGLRAGATGDHATKIALMRIHVPLGVLALLLTLARLVWWWRFDRKPEPAPDTPAWQERAARLVHALLLLVILGMAASGIGLMALSGAGPIVFGAGGGTLPEFTAYPPRAPHGLGARLMIALVVVHAAAALHHHLVRLDGTLRRMWFGPSPDEARR